MLFILPEMLLLLSSYSKFCDLSLSCPTLKMIVENGSIMTWNDLQKLRIVMFWITQRPLWIQTSK